MQQSSAQEPTSNLEMSRLREQLLGHDTPTSSASSYPPVPQSATGPDHPYRSSESTSPHDHTADQGPPQHGAQMAYSMNNDSGADDALGDRGKGKRELSTSKRAAQNRAAQRAFRQRKEGYIKKLEEQVKDFQSMESNYRSLQNENYQLREYILNLQSRLLENQSDIPPPPLHVNLQGTAPPGPSDERAARRETAQNEVRQGPTEANMRAHAAYNYATSPPQPPTPTTKRKSPS
ncbi:hypothetical protein AMS68_000066 [Peltaster fructicola]|uniref:Putative transcription factor kapC n=1 Tax=Peltaster fructicola TaxID=286661 RepID=A0A6H0XIT4_9PEZI|nr:hypothetical protein AMS68_000066 [Peltaster fructicola]